MERLGYSDQFLKSLYKKCERGAESQCAEAKARNESPPKKKDLTEEIYRSCQEGLALAKQGRGERNELSGKVEILSRKEWLFMSMGYAIRRVKTTRLEDFRLYREALTNSGGVPFFLGIYRVLGLDEYITLEDREAFLKSLFLKKALEFGSSYEEIVHFAAENGIKIPEIESFFAKAYQEGVSEEDIREAASKSGLTYEEFWGLYHNTQTKALNAFFANARQVGATKQQIMEAARKSGLTYEELRNRYTNDPYCLEAFNKRVNKLQARYEAATAQVENFIRAQHLREVERVERELIEIENALNQDPEGKTPEELSRLESRLQEITGVNTGNYGLYDQATNYSRFHADCARERISRGIHKLEEEIQLLADPFQERDLLSILPANFPDPKYTPSKELVLSGPEFRNLPSLLNTMVGALRGNPPDYLSHPDHFTKLSWELRQYETPIELGLRVGQRMLQTIIDRINGVLGDRIREAIGSPLTIENYSQFLDWYFSEGSESEKKLLIRELSSLSREMPPRLQPPRS